MVKDRAASIIADPPQLPDTYACHYMRQHRTGLIEAKDCAEFWTASSIMVSRSTEILHISPSTTRCHCQAIKLLRIWTWKFDFELRERFHPISCHWDKFNAADWIPVLSPTSTWHWLYSLDGSTCRELCCGSKDTSPASDGHHHFTMNISNISQQG